MSLCASTVVCWLISILLVGCHFLALPSAFPPILLLFVVCWDLPEELIYLKNLFSRLLFRWISSLIQFTTECQTEPDQCSGTQGGGSDQYRAESLILFKFNLFTISAKYTGMCSYACIYC